MLSVYSLKHKGTGVNENGSSPCFTHALRHSSRNLCVHDARAKVLMKTEIKDDA